MRPANVFQVELACLLAGRRTLAMKLALPLLAALPFALADMPAGIKAGGVAMLVLFISLFGSAVAMVRRRGDGLLTRLRLLPIPRWLVVCDFLLAGAAMDVVQGGGAIAMLLLAAATAVTPAGLLVMAAALCATVLLLNAAGMALAAAIKGSAEVHLAAAVLVGLLGSTSGLFPVPPPLAAAAGAIAPYNPIAYLAASLRQAIGAEAAAAPPAWALAAAGAILAAMAASLAARLFSAPGSQGETS